MARTGHSDSRPHDQRPGATVNGASSPRRLRDEPDDEPLRDQDRLLDDVDEDEGRNWESSVRDEPQPFIAQGEFQEPFGEQVDFRERFDDDMYNDREDHPPQGNTADVAMGDQRFGSDAEAYTEYAFRRPGDHRAGDESAVGQARDPADIADEDESP